MTGHDERSHRPRSLDGGAADHALRRRSVLVETGGITLHALVQGRGRPVVFLHGAHGSSMDFSLRVAPLLAGRYTTVSVDRPGAGRSGRRPGLASPLAQARLLRAGLAEMGFERPILVGHSMGAAVALAWALDDGPEPPAVVTVGGYFLPYDGYHSPLALWLGRPLIGPLLAATVVPVLGRALAPTVLRRAFLPDDPEQHYARLAVRAALTPAHLRHDAEDRRALDDGLREIRPRYHRLRPPVVALAGLQDAVVSPWQSKRLVELVPHGELVLLPATGHLPQLTRPEAVAAAVERAALLADRLAPSAYRHAAR